MVDPEVLDKIKRACSPQKAIYDIANYVETDVIPPINEATDTANAAAAQANSAYNRATDALNTANAVAGDVARSLVDLTAGGDGSTVTLNAPRNTGNPATAPLPVADATKAGVMNSATYVNLQNLNTRVSSLENQTTTYIVSFTNDNPTQDEINNAYKTAYPTAPFPPIDGTTVIDSTRQLYYRWVKNGAIWLKTTGFVVSQFTNETLGTIKGSTTAGQIQAETDGTGSLVGYDQIKNDITANATGIQTLTTNLGTTNTNVTNLDGRVTAVEGRVNNSLIALSSKSDATGVTITGTKQAGQPSETQIPVASATQAGVVTPTMFNAWNNSSEYEYQNYELLVTSTRAKTFTIEIPEANLQVYLETSSSGDVMYGLFSVTSLDGSSLSGSYGLITPRTDGSPSNSLVAPNASGISGEALMFRWDINRVNNNYNGKEIKVNATQINNLLYYINVKYPKGMSFTKNSEVSTGGSPI